MPLQIVAASEAGLFSYGIAFETGKCGHNRSYVGIYLTYQS
jgi:hypothetical protein